MRSILRRFAIVPYFTIGLILAALGLLALNQVVNNFWPVDVLRIDLFSDIATGRADSTELLKAANFDILAAFLASEFVAFVGLSLPLTYFLNKRFGRSDSQSFLVVLRQAMWVGVWFVFCTWLQINRSLGWAVALMVAVVLFIVELLLQIKNRAAAMSNIGEES
jgi:hypothetical protein